MKAYLTLLLAAGAVVLALGVSEPAHARHGWHGGHWGWHGGWGWRGWGWGPRWGWRGWGPGVGVYVGPRVAYGPRCWSRRYGWVPCRWYY